MADNTAQVRQIRDRASALSLQSEIFRTDTVQTWHQATADMDSGAVQASAIEIIQGWETIAAQQRTLEQLISRTKSGKAPLTFAAQCLAEPKLGDAGKTSKKAKAAQTSKSSSRSDSKPAAAPAGASESLPSNPEELAQVAEFRKQVGYAKQMIGVTVGLQRLGKQYMLGAQYFYDPSPDPAAFVRTKRDEAVGILTKLQRLSAIFASPEEMYQWRAMIDALEDEDKAALLKKLDDPNQGLSLSDRQEKVATKIIMSTTTRMQLNYLSAAVRKSGYGVFWSQLFSGGDTGKKNRHHNSALMDKASLTHDGRQGKEVPHERIMEMRKDAARIANEVDDVLYASDSKINSILAKYSSPAERTMFFSLLERENVIDAMLKRGDTKNIRQLLDSTEKHKGRRYNKSYDSSMTLGESTAYIASEAARQTPGAALHFVGGVYDGLSHIPVVGGVFGDAAKGFRDLAKEADKLTGADDTGRKWRNAVASMAGNLEAGLLLGGVGAEASAAGGVVAAGNTGVKAYSTAKKVTHYVDELYKLKGVYENGRFLIDTAMTTFKEIPSMLTSVNQGDFDGTIASVSSVFDGLIGVAGNMLARKHTVKAKKGRLSELQGQSQHLLVLEAKARVVRATRALESGPTADKQRELQHAGNNLRTAMASRRGDGPADPLRMQPIANAEPWLQRVNVAANDKMTMIVISMIKKLLTAIKNAIVDALLAAKHRADREKLGIATDDKPKNASLIAGGENLKTFIATKVVDGAVAGAGMVVPLIEKQLAAYGGKFMWRVTEMALKSHPELQFFKDPMTAAFTKMSTEGLALIDLNGLVTPTIKSVASDVATAMMMGFGYDDPRKKAAVPANRGKATTSTKTSGPSGSK